MTDGNTAKVIEWVLSRPVLTQRLRLMAFDGAGTQELACTVADLLDPNRKTLWIEYLHATGTPLDSADALWKELGGILGIYTVDWGLVQQRLVEAGPLGQE